MNKDKIISYIIIAISFMSFIFCAIYFHNSQNKDTNDVVMSEENIPFLETTSYYKAKVLDVKSEVLTEKEIDQELEVEILEGGLKGEKIIIKNSSVLDIDKSHAFTKGDTIVLTNYNEGEYFVNDHLRINGLIISLLILMITIIYFARMRGIGAILGLLFSVLVLIYYIVPGIVSGSNITIITLFGIFIISGISVFLAHGISKKTNIIWISVISTLLIAIGLSHLFVELNSLFGRASDVGFSFYAGDYSFISLKGLLLAGLVIGVFGVLTDVSSTQVAAIWQLKKANPNLTMKELYNMGSLIGREHIASLVNTLVLVYVGSSLPLFIVIMGADPVPLWAIINSEMVAEEVIRGIVGSVSLILGVPISNFFASYFVSRDQDSFK